MQCLEPRWAATRRRLDRQRDAVVSGRAAHAATTSTTRMHPAAPQHPMRVRDPPGPAASRRRSSTHPLPPRTIRASRYQQLDRGSLRVRQLSGFRHLPCRLVRPGRAIAGLETWLVKKKLKDKASPAQ